MAFPGTRLGSRLLITLIVICLTYEKQHSMTSFLFQTSFHFASYCVNKNILKRKGYILKNMGINIIITYRYLDKQVKCS